jgi:membrane protease YdiL (CAAX protease family)
MVYAALFLVITSGSFYLLLTQYEVHLVATQRFGLVRSVQEYFSPAQSLFFLLQVLTLLIVFRPLVKQMFDFRAILALDQSVFRNIFFGFSAGVIALLSTFPILLGNNRPSDSANFIANGFYTGSGLGLALLQVFLLPVPVEIFFRGILLRQLMKSISVVSAVIVTTLVFTLSWPTFSVIAGLALGVAGGILFYRTRSVFACVVANAVFTLGAITFQIARL